MDITIPNPPGSLADVDELLIAGAQDCLRPAFEFMEALWGPDGASPDPAKYRRAKHIHQMLNTAGYLTEELLGLPEHSLAGGSGKPPW